MNEGREYLHCMRCSKWIRIAGVKMNKYLDLKFIISHFSEPETISYSKCKLCWDLLLITTGKDVED